jgi:predicted DCC family thiol-disulfide oxidoreductase YuxK
MDQAALMFYKCSHTQYPPNHKPVLVWDGTCDFCHYWVLRWQSNTGDAIDYVPYQHAAERFADIPEEYFRSAAQLIEPGGQVYSGPDAAYRSLHYANPPNDFWHSLYVGNKVFRWLSNHAYQFMAQHRPAMYRLTHLLWGRNPKQPKHYWLGYLLVVVFVVIIAVVV